MKPAANDDAPFHLLAEELEGLRRAVREMVEMQRERQETRISKVLEAVEKLAGKKKVPTAKQRDLRDMLGLLRSSSGKPGKGRIKDLKKLDATVDDLVLLTEHW